MKALHVISAVIGGAIAGAAEAEDGRACRRDRGQTRGHQGLIKPGTI